MSDSQAGDSYHHGDLRNAMIAAAARILSEEGAEQVTFRRLSRELGVSHNAPYRHFKNQAALYAVLCQQGLETLRDELEAVMRESPEDVPQQIIAFARVYVMFAVAHAPLYRLMFTRQVISTEDERDDQNLVEIFRLAAAALTQLFAQGQYSGKLKSGDPARQALTFWGLLHGMAMLWIDQQAAPYFVAHNETVQTAVTASVRILLDGMA